MLKSRSGTSDYAEFHFYETTKYCESNTYPRNNDQFGKWLGPYMVISSSPSPQNQGKLTLPLLGDNFYGNSA